MAIPATPDYLKRHIADKQAPPGHRFGPYFPIWRTDWTLDKNKKKVALEQVLAFGGTAIELIKKVKARQIDNADRLGKNVYKITAKSSAPFVTGVGMENPVENGFAFLTPYGLPYLAGSGVKGVLRKAAEELALSGDLADRKNWDIFALWRLFGFEATSASLGVTGKLPKEKLLSDMTAERKRAYLAVISELSLDDAREFMEAVLPSEKRRPYRDDPHAFLAALVNDKKLRDSLAFRGALSLWDVFPESPEGKLGIEILNPHYTQYYQQGAIPADCEPPIHSFFLVVPPGTTFIFHVQCTTNQLPYQLTSSWRQLLQAAFVHAFDWLGFGAKTSVGYGSFVVPGKNKEQMTMDTDTQKGQVNIIQIDPAAERQKKVDRFVQNLPKSAELPGQASEILARIKGMKEKELRKECLKQLTAQFKNVINKGVKNRKKWALAIVACCKEEG